MKLTRLHHLPLFAALLLPLMAPAVSEPDPRAAAHAAALAVRRPGRAQPACWPR